MTTSTLQLDQAAFENPFVDELRGEVSGNKGSRQVPGYHYSQVAPTPVREPKLLAWSEELGNDLGLARPTERGAAVALLAVALLLGLALTGVTALSLLERSLLGQMDGQLRVVAQPLAQHAYESISGLPGPQGDADSLPSDYYVLFFNASGAAVAPWSSRPTGSEPSILGVADFTTDIPVVTDPAR